MSDNFELQTSSDSGSPVLYLHGLGSPDPMAKGLSQPLADLGYAISELHRDDEAILNSKNPERVLIDGAISAISSLEKQTKQKVILIGNSLGSYLAVMAARENQELVSGVLGTDAFLEPINGFITIKENAHNTHKTINQLLSEGKSIDSPWSEFPQRFETAGKGRFPCLLINDRWINLSNDLHENFTKLAPEASNPMNIPMHLIWGTKDPFIKSQKLPTDILKGASGFPVNGANHNEWMEYSAAIDSATEFLENLVNKKV